MQIHFVSTYNGDDVKIVALFSKANLPEKNGGKGGFYTSLLQVMLVRIKEEM